MDLSETRGNQAHRHPWEVARADFFLRVLRRAVGLQNSVRVLDVGCGDAWFAQRLLETLPAASTITGWDAALDPERLAQATASLPSRITLTRTPPDGLFGLILCMDVIEHVEDDYAFLGEVVERYLEPGGRLLFTVPAWPALFSVHDVALGHYRRYTPTTGTQLLQSVGLHIRQCGGLFHMLAPLRWWQARRWRQAPPDPAALGIGGWSAPAWITWGLTTVLRLEGTFSAVAASWGAEVPGLTWWALCER